MATGAARTYNLAQTIITIGGLPVEGFGADDAFSFEPNSPIYETTVGADGEVTRSATNDRSGTITITLMETSPSLAILNTYLQLSKTTAIGDIFPVYMRDLNSGDEIIAQQCWIEEEPAMSKGKGAGEREWILRAAKVTVKHGGAIR